MAVISNIHYNLSAWLGSHVYVTGNRVTNGGNAYECVTSGTSGLSGTGGPTGGASNITDNTVIWKFLSKVDFTSLQSWHDSGWPGTLVDNLVASLWNNGPITTTVSGGFGVPYLTTSGTHTMGNFTATVMCAPGESFRDKLIQGKMSALQLIPTNGVTFQLPGTIGNNNYFFINDKNIIFDGIQFLDPLSNSNCTHIIWNSGAIGGVLRNCIFDGFPQSGAVILDMFDIIVLDNVLLIDRQTAGGTNPPVRFSTNGSVFNSFIISINIAGGIGGIIANGSNTNGLLVKNSGVFGYNGITSTSVAGAMQASNCIFDFSATLASLGVGDGGGNRLSISAASTFVGPNSNLFLTTTSPALKSRLSNVGAANDMSGFPRPTRTIGSIGPNELQGTLSSFDPATFNIFTV